MSESTGCFRNELAPVPLRTLVHLDYWEISASNVVVVNVLTRGKVLTSADPRHTEPVSSVRQLKA